MENQTTIHPTLFETYKGLDSHQKYLQHLCLKVMLVSAGASQHQLTGTLLEDDMGFYLIISCLKGADGSLSGRTKSHPQRLH